MGRGSPQKSWKLKISLKIQRARVHNFRNSGSISTKLSSCDLSLLGEEFGLPEIDFALGLAAPGGLTSGSAMPVYLFSIYRYFAILVSVTVDYETWHKSRYWTQLIKSKFYYLSHCYSIALDNGHIYHPCLSNLSVHPLTAAILSLLIFFIKLCTVVWNPGQNPTTLPHLLLIFTPVMHF